MSYSADELYRFNETEGGYSVEEYLKGDDPSVTEPEIPEEWKGKPVSAIAPGAFEAAMYLKHVKLPKSIKTLCYRAFADCWSLESVEFEPGAEIELESDVFTGCDKLPAETLAIGLLRSVNLTAAFEKGHCPALWIFDTDSPDKASEVFEILAKNNCYREASPDDLEFILGAFIGINNIKALPIAEKYGLLENAGLVNSLLAKAIESERTEMTAFLLDYKNRKFGFDGGEDFEL